MQQDSFAVDFHTDDRFIRQAKVKLGIVGCIPADSVRKVLELAQEYKTAEWLRK